MNVYKPLIGFNLLKAITLLKDACRSFRVNLVEGMEPDRERITALVESSLMLVTALTPPSGTARPVPSPSRPIAMVSACGGGPRLRSSGWRDLRSTGGSGGHGNARR